MDAINSHGSREELIAYLHLMEHGPHRKTKELRGTHRKQGDLINLLAEFRWDTRTGRQTGR
jgi:hypothetical protein